MTLMVLVPEPLLSAVVMAFAQVDLAEATVNVLSRQMRDSRPPSSSIRCERRRREVTRRGEGLLANIKACLSEVRGSWICVLPS